MTPRASVYGRQSAGKQKSIREQITAGHAAISHNGWTPAGDYSDGVGASRHSAKKRDEWARLLEDIRRDVFDIIILWESSRGDRTLSSWALFLDECRNRHIQIFVVVDDHLYDLDRPRDWKTLASAGVDAAAETDLLSIRTRRGHAGAAAEGKPPGGPTPYGYRRTFDPHTGQRTGQRIDPTEADIVREIYAKVAQGHPILTLTNELNARNIPWRHQHPWKRDGVRNMIRNPAYIAVRRLNGTDHAGQWEPIVDTALWHAANRVLDNPERRQTRPGRQKHLLTYLALCAVCDSWIDYAATKYKCQRAGCVSIPQDVTDEIVTHLILERLSNPDTRPALADDDHHEALAAARAEAAQLRAQLDQWRDSAVRGETSPGSLAAIERGLSAQIQAADALIRELAAPLPLAAILEPGADVRERWFSAPVPVRRQIVAAACEIRIDVGRPGRYPQRVGVVAWNMPRLGRSRWRGDTLTWAQRWA